MFTVEGCAANRFWLLAGGGGAAQRWRAFIAFLPPERLSMAALQRYNMPSSYSASPRSPRTSFLLFVTFGYALDGGAAS